MAFRVFSISITLLFRRMGLLLLGNLFWILLSLPVITWPAATGALFHLVDLVVKEEAGTDMRAVRASDYWRGVLIHWRKSTVLMAFDVLTAVVLAVALFAYATSDIEAFRWLAGPILLVSVAWLGAQLYLFPLLIASPGSSVFATARSALLTAISYPIYTSTLVVLLSVVTAMCLVLLGPVLLLLFSLLAVTQTVALRTLRVRRGEVTSSPEEWRVSGA